MQPDASRMHRWHIFGTGIKRTKPVELVEAPEVDHSTVFYNTDSQKFESKNPQDIALMDKFNHWISLLSAPYSNYRDIELVMLWETEDIKERLDHILKYLPRYCANIEPDKFSGERREMLKHIKTVHLPREALDHLGIFVYDVLVIAKKGFFDVLKELRDCIIKTMKDPNLELNDLEVRFYLYQGMRMLRYIEFRAYPGIIDWENLNSELPQIPIPPKFNLQNDLSRTERIELNSPNLDIYK